VAELVAEEQGECAAGATVDFRGDWAERARLVAGEGGAQAFLVRGIAVLPDDVAGVYEGEVDGAAAEGEQGVGAAREDLVDAAAGLALLGRSVVEDDAVARL